MPHRLNSAKCRFRPALPKDRRQIRLLLRRCHDDATNAVNQEHWHAAKNHPEPSHRVLCLGSGLLLGIGAHWLWAVGGLLLLLWCVLGMSTVAVAFWLNLWVFEDWSNYWVIEQQNRLIACGKLTCYDTYSTICDVVVTPERRQQGIGSHLVASIVQQGTQPLYLACTPKLAGFYQRLGFVAVNPQQLTTYLRQELGLTENSKLMALQFLKRHSTSCSSQL
jgi:N-acetylglutamate synthase-like GNAT family acetyltransferase